MTDTSREFAARVRWARRAHGLTQHDLALQLGWFQSRLAKIETGKQNVWITDAMRLAESLGTSVGALIGEQPLTINAAYDETDHR